MANTTKASIVTSTRLKVEPKTKPLTSVTLKLGHTKQKVFIPEDWYVVSGGNLKIKDHYLYEGDSLFRTHTFLKVPGRHVGYPVSRYKLVIRSDMNTQIAYPVLLNRGGLAELMPSGYDPFDGGNWSW